MSDEEARLDAEWHALPLDEKRELLRSHFVVETLNPDTLRLIAGHFKRDPWSFYALAATCKMARDALGGDFYPHADPAYFQIWIERLCRRVNARSSMHIGIRCCRTFDEKARYVTLGHQTGILCSVDKYTGLVLNSEHSRAVGYVTVREPEGYFAYSMDFCVGLRSHRDMIAADPTYAEKKCQYITTFKAATEELKSMPRIARKRLFSEVWDETDLRRQRYRLK